MALKSYAGGSLFAQVHGDGAPAVVALHGWGRRGSDFDPVLRGLDAIAFDLPGFGSSPPPDAVCGAAGYAELLAPVIAAIGKPPLVVGHSFGGRVAVKLAGLVDVSGLVLTGVPLVRTTPSRRPSASYRLARFANRIGILGNVRMEQLRRRRGSADYRAASGVMRDVLVTVVNESYDQELSELSIPVALLWGDQDREVPPAVAERARTLIPDCSLSVLATIGHHVPLEAPAALRSAIEAMLAR